MSEQRLNNDTIVRRWCYCFSIRCGYFVAPIAILWELWNGNVETRLLETSCEAHKMGIEHPWSNQGGKNTALQPPLSFPGEKFAGDGSVSRLQMGCDPWLEQLLPSRSHMTALPLQLPPSFSLSHSPPLGILYMKCIIGRQGDSDPLKGKLHQGNVAWVCPVIAFPDL